LEEPTLSGFKSGWLEALGDLARYRMAVAAMVGGSVRPTATLGPKALTIKAVNESSTHQTIPSSDNSEEKSISDKPAARIDDSPSPSVGIAAARLMDVEPETERWRGIARDWYGAGLAEQPGTGKLHHHLGLLCREVEGEELRGVYHFVKRYSRSPIILVCVYISFFLQHDNATSLSDFTRIRSSHLVPCRTGTSRSTGCSSSSRPLRSSPRYALYPYPAR
jgi:hypothetical protein